MDPQSYLLMTTTALVAALVAILVFAVLRVGTAARDMRAGLGDQRGETAFMAMALQEAVTKLRTQEQAMKARAEASERLSSEIIASMSSGLIVAQVDGSVRMINPAGERMLALGGPVGDRPYREVLAAAGPLVAVIDEALATGRPIVRRTLQMRAESADPGGPTHLGVTVSPIGTAEHLQGVICLFTDLSAVAELEEQLRLRQGLSTLGELTAGMAHEFRNGLATIHGYSRLIDLDRLPAEHRPYLTSIREETEALGQIVTNFLNFARPVPLSLGVVDLRALADRAAEEIRGEALARGGDVHVVGDWRPIEGDDVLLRQALSNLCRNALEATMGSGTPPSITIEGAADPAGDVVRLSVGDNGPGVDPALRDRVFRPFFTTKATGTGLGLAIVQKIVVTHGGRVSVGDRSGGGARFQITLPARQHSMDAAS